MRFTPLILIAIQIISCNHHDGEKILFPKDKLVDTLDFNMTPDNEITVVVTINGEEYTLLLDTGTSTTIINENIPSKKTNYYSNMYDYHGNEYFAPFVVIDTFSIANINFFQHKEFLQRYVNKYDGILGGDILNKFAWKIDFFSRKIYISENAENFGSSAFSEPFVLKNKCPYIKGNLGNVDMEFLFDTGSNSFLIKEKKGKSIYLKTDTILWRKLNSIPNNVLQKNDTVRIDTSCIAVADFSIGKNRLADEIIILNGNYNLLGIDFCKRFSHVILDYPGSKIHFGDMLLKSTNYLSDLLEDINGNGVRISQYSLPIITGLTLHSEKIGLALWDTILAIDGITVFNRDTAFYRDISKRHNGYTHTTLSEYKKIRYNTTYWNSNSILKIKKGNEVKIVKLKRQVNCNEIPDTIQDLQTNQIFLFSSIKEVHTSTGYYYSCIPRLKSIPLKNKN